jgi:hypothetical protein
MKCNRLTCLVITAVVFSLWMLPGCSGLGSRASRTGPAPITTAVTPSDPWASVAPSLGTGDGVTLPPDTALPVRKGR